MYNNSHKAFQEAKKFIRVYLPFKSSETKSSLSLYKLTEENIGKSLFNNALGGLLGSFSNKIKRRKNKQTVISKIKGNNKVNFFIFLKLQLCLKISL